jgi:hypothetical protein
MHRLLLLGVLVGCERTVAEETDLPVEGTCEETATTPLAMDEASPLGFSADELGVAIGGYVYGRGHWSVVDASSDVMVHSESFDNAVFHERAMSAGTDATCVSTVTMDATTQLEAYIPDTGGTDMWPHGTVEAASLDSAELTATIGLDEGASVTEEVTGVVLDDYQDVAFTLANEWTFAIGFDPTIAGTLTIEGTKVADGESYSAVLLTWPE